MSKLISLMVVVGLVVLAVAQYGIGEEGKKEPVYEGKPLKEWIKAFQDPDPNIRDKARRALGKMGANAAPAIPVLIRSLDEIDISNRTMVFITLSEIGKPAVPALLEVFKDQSRNRFVRGDAANALSRIGADAKEAIPDLIKALKDPEMASSASSVLGDIGKAALPRLLEALKGEDDETRGGAAKALGQMGADAEEAVPILRQALKGSDVAFRVQAAKALLELHPKNQEALSTLIGSLTDEKVQSEAMDALGKIGPDAREAVPALEAILKADEGIGFSRVLTASAILRIQPTHKAALGVVIGALKQDRLALMALMALKSLGPGAQQAVPSVVALLKSEKVHVVNEAVETLGYIGPAAKEAVPALIEASRDPKTRWSAIIALGDIGSPEAVPALIQLLKDPDPALRRSSALALGKIGPASKAAIPPLLEALKDRDDDVRGYVIMALGQIKPDAKTILPHLVEAVKDQNLRIRGLAILKMGEIGPEAKSAVPTILEAAKTDKDLSQSAAIALGQIGPDAKAGVPFLMELLKDQKSDTRQYGTRMQAAYALWRIEGNKEVTLPVLREALKDPQAYVRIHAALALWRMGDDKEKMIELLMDMLKDKKNATQYRAMEARYMRIEAVAALGEIGPEAKAAVPVLIELLGDKYDFRKEVPKALKKIDPAAAAKAGVP